MQFVIILYMCIFAHNHNKTYRYITIVLQTVPVSVYFITFCFSMLHHNRIFHQQKEWEIIHRRDDQNVGKSYFVCTRVKYFLICQSIYVAIPKKDVKKIHVEIPHVYLCTLPSKQCMFLFILIQYKMWCFLGLEQCFGNSISDCSCIGVLFTTNPNEIIFVYCSFLL